MAPKCVGADTAVAAVSGGGSSHGKAAGADASPAVEGAVGGILSDLGSAHETVVGAAIVDFGGGKLLAAAAINDDRLEKGGRGGGGGGLLTTDAATDEVVVVLMDVMTAASVTLGPLSLMSMSLPESA